MVTATIDQWSNVIHAWVKPSDPARCEQHFIVPRTREHRRSLIRTLRKMGVTQFKIT